MAKFSNRKEAITSVKLLSAGEAILYLVEEQLQNAEAEILGCNPQDPAMRDKLVKAQTFRNFITTLRSDLK